MTAAAFDSRVGLDSQFGGGLREVFALILDACANPDTLGHDVTASGMCLVGAPA